MGAFLPGICNCVRAEGQVSSLLKIIGSWQALRDCGWVGGGLGDSGSPAAKAWLHSFNYSNCLCFAYFLDCYMIIEDLFLMVYSLSSKFPQKERNKRNLIKKKGT